MDPADLLVLILATWRLTSLFSSEDGPLNLFALLRVRVGVRYDERSQPYGTNPFAVGLLCSWCSSVWWGALLTILYVALPTPTLYGALFLALSAGTILIEKYMG